MRRRGGVCSGRFWATKRSMEGEQGQMCENESGGGGEEGGA